MWQQPFIPQFIPIINPSSIGPQLDKQTQPTAQIPCAPEPFVKPPIRQPKRKVGNEPKAKRGRPRKETQKVESEKKMAEKLSDFQTLLSEEKIPPSRMQLVADNISAREARMQKSALQLSKKYEQEELKAVEKRYDELKEKFLSLFSVIRKDAHLMRELEQPLVRSTNEFFKAFGAVTIAQAEKASTLFTFNNSFYIVLVRDCDTVGGMELPAPPIPQKNPCNQSFDGSHIPCEASLSQQRPSPGALLSVDEQPLEEPCKEK